MLDGLTDGEKDSFVGVLIPPAEAISGVKAVYGRVPGRENQNGHQLTGSEMRGDHIPFLFKEI